MAMEFLRVVKRRSVLSETIYILLNIALAVGVLIAIWATGTPWLALALVLLSKWRVLAVRPRYWFAHIEANMVDFIVSISAVTLVFLAGQSAGGRGVFAQVVLTLAYAAWLLLLKPRARRGFVVAQAGVAILLGTMSLASVSYEWPSSLVVACMWIIGYSSARHILVAYGDNDIRLLSLIWGFVVAELGWVAYHWTIAYPLFFLPGIKLPQEALLILGLSFLAERAYSSYHKHDVIKQSDLVLPLVFTLSLFAVLLWTQLNQASIGSV
jgi:hypothetical protein